MRYKQPAGLGWDVLGEGGNYKRLEGNGGGDGAVQTCLSRAVRPMVPDEQPAAVGVACPGDIFGRPQGDGRDVLGPGIPARADKGAFPSHADADQLRPGIEEGRDPAVRW